MALLDRILGNASEVDPEDLQEGYHQILGSGERIEKAYQLIRDHFLFTNKRLILVDRQGVTGRKVGYHSIPYGKITHFSVETAGHFDLDAELKIWISGAPSPIAKQFNKKLNIYEVQALLTDYVAP